MINCLFHLNINTLCMICVQPMTTAYYYVFTHAYTLRKKNVSVMVLYLFMRVYCRSKRSAVCFVFKLL